MFVWSGVAIAVMLIASPAQPLAQAKINVSGQWVLDVQTDQGGGSPTFVFKQDGEKLTGKYSGLFGEAEITGTVKGQSINFSFSGDAQGTAVKVTYEGTVESNDSMKGKVDLGGVGQGTFTGKRVK
jgi:hypothetical protein